MGTTGTKTIQSRNLVNTFQCNWLDYFQLQAQVQKRGRRCQPSSAARSKNTFPWGRDVGKNGCVGRADAQRAAPSTLCSVTPWKQLCWLPAPGGCWAGSPGQCSDAHLACPVVPNWDPSSSIWFSPSTEESTKEERHFALPVKGEICTFWIFQALSSMLQSPLAPASSTYDKCPKAAFTFCSQAGYQVLPILD